LYTQAPIPVTDPPTFDQVRNAVESSFSTTGIEPFLNSLEKSKLRIREFEQVLAAGRLGPASEAQYQALTDGDQGMIRELYLASLERVPLKLRDKYFKLYAYY
jgi:hypothetical protein